MILILILIFFTHLSAYSGIGSGIGIGSGMGNCYNIDMDAVNRAEVSIDRVLKHSTVDYTHNGKYTTEQVRCGLREEYYQHRQAISNDYILKTDYSKSYKNAFRQ